MGSPVALAVANGEVFWAGEGGVWRAPTAGGRAVPIDANDDDGEAIAIDGPNVYWATLGRIMKADASGTVTELVYTEGPVVSMMFRDDDLLWLGRDGTLFRAWK